MTTNRERLTNGVAQRKHGKCCVVHVAVFGQLLHALNLRTLVVAHRAHLHQHSAIGPVSEKQLQ